MLSMLQSARLPSRNGSAKKEKNGAPAAELPRHSGPAPVQYLQENRRAKELERKEKQPPGRETKKLRRAGSTGTILAWRTRGYGLMISRLQNKDCAGAETQLWD